MPCVAIHSGFVETVGFYILDKLFCKWLAEALVDEWDLIRQRERSREMARIPFW